MFAWISDLAYFFASFFPHLRIIRSTHEGVRFRRGVPKKIESGRLILYWPIVTQLVILPKVRQTTETAPQFLTTFDGQPVAVGTVIVYHISDVFSAVTQTFDIYSVIDDITQTSVAALVSQTPFEEIEKDIYSFNVILSREISSELERYGISVEKVAIMGFSKCMVLRNIHDQLSWNPGRQMNVDTGEREL